MSNDPGRLEEERDEVLLPGTKVQNLLSFCTDSHGMDNFGLVGPDVSRNCFEFASEMYWAFKEVNSCLFFCLISSLCLIEKRVIVFHGCITLLLLLLENFLFLFSFLLVCFLFSHFVDDTFLLQVSKPRQLWPPKQLDGWWVVVRLERFQPAVLDAAMEERLLLEQGEHLLQNWLQQQQPRLRLPLKRESSVLS